MKTVFVSILSGTLMIGFATAQQSPKPAAQTPQAGAAQADAVTRIAPGSVIPVSLTKTIDAKKVKSGDEVVAKVTQDLKNTNGDVIVAKDTEVMGHVTEAQARSKQQRESQVGIEFDRAVMKNGTTMQLPMSIQAIIGPQNDQSNPANGTSEMPASSSAANPNANMGGRPGMAGSAPAPMPSSAGGDTPSDAQTGAKSRPPITAQTQGVLGISNLTLTPAAMSQGSLLTSEKNNVKLESGTLMLLRVN
jgi:hypothetical protein